MMFTRHRKIQWCTGLLFFEEEKKCSTWQAKLFQIRFASLKYTVFIRCVSKFQFILPALQEGRGARTLPRVQISTMALKNNLMVAGGFRGELIFKV
jgi:hypothetical protein